MASATRSNSGVMASCCSIAARIASMGKRPVYGSSSLRISGIVIGPAHRFTGGGGLEGFPDPLARDGFQTAQLAVTADAIDVSVLQKGRAHDGIEMRGVFLAGFFRAPNGGGGRFVALELHHERAV